MRDPQFESFVRTHSPALLRLAYLLSRDHQQAEDLVQEALLSALRHWDSVIAADRPGAYVRRMLVNIHVSALRRASSREITFDPDLLVLGDTGSTDRHDEIDARSWAASVLANLTESQRAVLVLRYYERLDDQEIADLLHVARGTVRSLAARAFAALREHPQLANYADPPDDARGTVTSFRVQPGAPSAAFGREGRA
jgi:RNA polymerase sigma-70 factor (sigma-E family)